MTYELKLKLSDLLISIHILHTKDDINGQLLLLDLLISIHILHTKDDFSAALSIFAGCDFNPHPSHEG